MTGYQPVSCALHSQYELYAMHNTAVKIERNDARACLEGVIKDIRVIDAAEYLVLLQHDAIENLIRLDNIKTITARGDANDTF